MKPIILKDRIISILRRYPKGLLLTVLMQKANTNNKKLRRYLDEMQDEIEVTDVRKRGSVPRWLIKLRLPKTQVALPRLSSQRGINSHLCMIRIRVSMEKAPVGGHIAPSGSWSSVQIRSTPSHAEPAPFSSLQNGPQDVPSGRLCMVSEMSVLTPMHSQTGFLCHFCHQSVTRLRLGR